MNKLTQNFFSKGANNTLRLNNKSSFSYRGSWVGVHPNTVIDTFHVGEFSSAIYQITVEYDAFEKEIMQLSVVARPGKATATIFGRSSIENELIDIDVTVDDSMVKIIASPKSLIYSGSKLIYHATYAEIINPIVAPPLSAQDSTVEDTGINTFDSDAVKLDNTNKTFDEV